jgi:glutathione S-transferase
MLMITEQECDLVTLSRSDVATMPEIRSISPLGMLPVLVTESASLFTINSILKHIAKLRKEKGFAGLLFKEESQIDQWLDLTSSEVDPLTTLIYDQMTSGNPHGDTVDSAFKELRKILRVLETKFREDCGYIVGYGYSVADVSMASSLSLPFWPVFRDYFSGYFPFVTKWLLNCQERFCFSSVSFTLLRYRLDSSLNSY